MRNLHPNWFINIMYSSFMYYAAGNLAKLVFGDSFAIFMCGLLVLLVFRLIDSGFDWENSK